MKKIYGGLCNFNSDMSHRNIHFLTTSKRNYKLYAQKRRWDICVLKETELSILKRNNPRAFYGLFRKRTGKSNCEIQLSEFYNHFKNLSFSTCYTVTNSSQDSNYQFHPELDVLITKEEVSKIMHTLRREKSPGNNNLLNEYFIRFNDELVDYLLKLFNIILPFGCFPSAWSEGIFVPVFKKGDVDIKVLLLQVVFQRHSLLC
jgi:hypothetical protein